MKRYLKVRSSKLLVIKVSVAGITALAIAIALYVLSNNPLVFLSIPPAVLGLYPMINTSYKLYFIRILDNRFIEFLSLLVNFESVGLHIGDLFALASRGELILPKPYDVVAKKYAAIEKLYGDQIRALSYVQKLTRGSRFSRFIEGYIGILETTGDTLGFTEVVLTDELGRLESSIEGTIGFIENFYESYLIILLTVIVLTILPGASTISPIVYAALLIINTSAYILAITAASRLFYYDHLVSTGFTASLIAFFTLSPLVFPYIAVLTLGFILTSVFIVLTRIVMGWRIRVEEHIYELTEDLYSETRHGFPLDTALKKLSSREEAVYRGLASSIYKYLSLGLRGDTIASHIDTSPLVSRVFRLLLTPMEYSSDHSRHVGYTAKFLRRLYGMRGNVAGRARILYLYTLILPLTAYILGYGLSSIASSILNPSIQTDLIGYVIASSIPAWFTAVKAIDGYSLRSWKNMVIIIENLLLLLLSSSL